MYELWIIARCDCNRRAIALGTEVEGAVLAAESTSRRGTQGIKSRHR